jgi:hypothetical protein
MNPLPFPLSLTELFLKITTRNSGIKTLEEIEGMKQTLARPTNVVVG